MSQIAAPTAGASGAPDTQTEGPASGNSAEASTAPATTGAEDPDCDLNGTWIAQQITVSEALGVSQSSNNWYYFELSQRGTAVEVTRHFDCGIEVRGTVTVTLPRNAIESQLAENGQVGRKLSFRKVAGACVLESARFWSIRGARAERFLPDGVRDSARELREVATSLPLPGPDMPDGATDPDGDGKLGISFEISGLISGIRNSIQRDWSRWFTETGYEITPSLAWTSDLTIRADFDNEESVMDPTQGLLSSGSTPKAGAKHIVRLRFLGRELMDPRRSAIVKDSPVDTCYAIQDALAAEAIE